EQHDSAIDDQSGVIGLAIVHSQAESAWRRSEFSLRYFNDKRFGRRQCAVQSHVRQSTTATRRPRRRTWRIRRWWTWRRRTWRPRKQHQLWIADTTFIKRDQ